MAVTSIREGIEFAPWREHYPENVPTHLGYPARAAWCLLKRAAEESPQRIACWHLDTSWTYAELWNRAQSAAIRFTALGIRPGHRVALLLPNMNFWLPGEPSENTHRNRSCDSCLPMGRGCGSSGNT